MIKITWNKFIIVVLLMTIFMNEHGVYWAQTWRWLKFPDAKLGHDLVILLVSDPQLQGFEDERIFPLGTIDRWDADRYLLKNFELAFGYANPDIVIFLGDLFDEGSKAKPDDYETYFSRFHKIFALAHTKTTIYLPGDNDVGGEGYDIRTTDKVRRFERYFAPAAEIVNLNFLTFIKLDIHSTKIGKKLDLVKDIELKSNICILLGHESILPKRKEILFLLSKHIKSCFIFTGHWHESVHWTCHDCMRDGSLDHTWPVKREPFDDLLRIDLNDTSMLHEIQVPTCSYRMGVPAMGYGLAHVSREGRLTYGVLWIPPRYPLLIGYLLIATTILLVCVIRYCLLRWCLVQKRYHYR